MTCSRCMCWVWSAVGDSVQTFVGRSGMTSDVHSGVGKPILLVFVLLCVLSTNCCTMFADTVPESLCPGCTCIVVAAGLVAVMFVVLRHLWVCGCRYMHHLEPKAGSTTLVVNGCLQWLFPTKMQPTSPCAWLQTLVCCESCRQSIACLHLERRTHACAGRGISVVCECWLVWSCCHSCTSMPHKQDWVLWLLVSWLLLTVTSTKHNIGIQRLRPGGASSLVPP